jgi:hypothetical protein
MDDLSLAGRRSEIFKRRKAAARTHVVKDALCIGYRGSY